MCRIRRRKPRCALRATTRHRNGFVGPSGLEKSNKIHRARGNPGPISPVTLRTTVSVVSVDARVADPAAVSRDQGVRVVNPLREAVVCWISLDELRGAGHACRPPTGGQRPHSHSRREKKFPRIHAGRLGWMPRWIRVPGQNIVSVSFRTGPGRERGPTQGRVGNRCPFDVSNGSLLVEKKEDQVRDAVPDGSITPAWATFVPPCLRHSSEDECDTCGACPDKPAGTPMTVP